MMMKSLATPLALIAAVTLVSAPSFAQERGQDRQGHHDRSGRESSGVAVGRAQPRSEAPRTRSAAPAVESRQQAPRAESQRQAEAPRVENRQDANRRYDANRRDDANRGYDAGRAVPRREVIVPRGYAPRYAPRYSPRYSPRVYASRSYYRPYVFRPRISIGFGIFAGYPVPYAYSYPYPIAVYGYRAPRAPVIVGPGSPYYGGIALEINPPDA